MRSLARIFIGSALLLAIVSSQSFAQSFGSAKRLLYREAVGTTFYCGCAFTGHRVDSASCGIAPRKNARRALRTEAEHIVTAYEIGRERPCWSGGRKHCRKIDPVFREAEGDLVNLRIVSGELNGDRSNRPYGIVPGEPRVYGACDFEVDFGLDVAEPAEQIRGDIARVYFYMIGHYGVMVSGDYLDMLMGWAMGDPVSVEECSQDAEIRRLQGWGNPFVEAYCGP